MYNPNIHNLRKRAKALGLVITKASDASVTGYCEYVLHRDWQRWEHMRMYSLHGIANIIKQHEARK